MASVLAVEGSTERPRSVDCNGCHAIVPVNEAHTVLANGHQCHYCPACKQEYDEFVKDCARYEAALNTKLDEFIAGRRESCPLRVMPQDFPANVLARLS